MSKYNLRCPRCGAPPERAKLKVISGRFVSEMPLAGRFVSEMPLAEDGFWPSKKWDTEDEIVRCSSCTTVFPLYECLPHEQIAHVETIEIRGLEEKGDGALCGQMELAGAHMHVTMVRVKTNENHIQVADGDPIAHDLYDDLCKLDQRGPFHTTQIRGHDGEWVIFVIPHSRG
jgi:hypothetical protein